MNPAFVAADAERLLQRLAIPPKQFLEVRVVEPDRDGAIQRFCTTHEEALAVMKEFAGKANVYAGACPRSRRSGTKAAIRVVAATWADLDFHQIDANDRRRAERVAQERLGSFIQPPTMVVYTGNGLQAWWLYDQPVEVSDDSTVERFEAITRGIARALGGDSVQDLNRVLRVPGTMNLPDKKKRARGCVPVMATLVHVDGPTYVPGAFQSIAVANSINAGRRQASRVPIARPTRPDHEIVEAFQKLLAELGSGHLLVRTWRGDRSLHDSSRSGWDMALANQLVRVSVRAEFIPSLIRAYSLGRGVFATDDYIRRTVSKARSYKERTHGTPRVS